MKRIFVPTILFTIFIFQPAQAQFNLYTYYQGIYDDNIYNTSENVSDFINILSFGSAYNI